MLSVITIFVLYFHWIKQKMVLLYYVCLFVQLLVDFSIVWDDVGLNLLRKASSQVSWWHVFPFIGGKALWKALDIAWFPVAQKMYHSIFKYKAHWILFEYNVQTLYFKGPYNQVKMNFILKRAKIQKLVYKVRTLCTGKTVVAMFVCFINMYSLCETYLGTYAMHGFPLISTSMY